MSRIFNRSPGVTTIWHDDPEHDGIVLEKVFDREPVLEHAHAMRNEVRQRGELRKVASIPSPLFFKWLKEGRLSDCEVVDGRIVIDPKKLSQLLNDPEYQNLKCIDGAV